MGTVTEVNSDTVMSIPAYVATAMAPSFIFMLISTPVKKRNIFQEVTMASLWFIGLCIPIYYAGQLPYICLISTSVWVWATSMKMGVWVFSMTMEERRSRHFVYTLLDWRKRANNNVPSSAEIKKGTTPDYDQVHLGHYVRNYIETILKFDIVEFLFILGDTQRPVRTFTFFIAKFLNSIGYSEKALTIMPQSGNDPITVTYILISVVTSMLFCVYIQIQLQVTYDVFMVIFACIYKLLPILERWQLGEDSQKLNTKNIGKTKAILKRVKHIRAVKAYIEDTLSMPPLFSSPWTANSLRDFWGRRWHTFYNDCFYRLGYRPIRWIVMTLFNCKPPRWLPALAVFVMSGLMHEYFLYAATGSSLYFSGNPIPACGIQFAFFVIQVCAISIGDTFFARGFMGRLYTILCMAITCHLFVVPYLLTGYLYMERLSFYRLFFNYYRGNYESLFSFVY
jgi:hypothetical protein